jgi:hypothetical protein
LLDRGWAPVRVLASNEIPDGFHNQSLPKGYDIISDPGNEGDIAPAGLVVEKIRRSTTAMNETTM